MTPFMSSSPPGRFIGMRGSTRARTSSSTSPSVAGVTNRPGLMLLTVMLNFAQFAARSREKLITAALEAA